MEQNMSKQKFYSFEEFINNLIEDILSNLGEEFTVTRVNVEKK